MLQKSNHTFIILVSVPIRCNELAEPIAETYAKAYSERLHCRLVCQLALIRSTLGLNPVSLVRRLVRLPLNHIGGKERNIY